MGVAGLSHECPSSVTRVYLIDVTLITRYFRPYVSLNLYILSATLLLQGCNKGVT